MDQQPVAVGKTSDDAIISKSSAANFGYFNDEYLRHFVSKTARRSALINRGYYIRVKVIRQELIAFIKASKACQIISVGAGMDTSFFALHDELGYGPDAYVELDFPHIVKMKQAVFDAHPESFKLPRQGYHLLSCDLRDLAHLEKALQDIQFDFEKPTLVLSECVLMYMKPSDSNKVIEFFHAKLPNLIYFSYDQSLPMDTFGQVMLNALKKKGSSLFGLDAYKVVKEQEVRFRQFGFAKVYAIDVLSSFELLDQDEKDRIEKLEEWDEFEEFDIECVHYSFVMGFSNTKMTELLPKTDYPYHEYLEIPSSPTVVATVLNEHQQTLLNIWGHTVSNVDNVLYLIGGYGGEKMIRQKQSWFKPSLAADWKLFEPKSSQCGPQDRMFHSAATHNECIYVYGGRKNPKKALNELYMLNTQTKEWTQLANAPEVGRFRHSMVVIYPQLLIFGGLDGETCLNTMLTYNIETAKWTTHSTPLLPRFSHTAHVHQGKMLVLFGRSKETLHGQVWQYEPDTEKWSEVVTTNPPSARYAHDTVIHNGKLYLLGGSCPFVQNDYYQLDLETRVWTPQYYTAPAPMLMLTKNKLVHQDDQLCSIGGGAMCFSFGSVFSPTFTLTPATM